MCVLILYGGKACGFVLAGHMAFTGFSVVVSLAAFSVEIGVRWQQVQLGKSHKCPLCFLVNVPSKYQDVMCALLSK